ncbi:30S ribosomal protein S13 [Candidatus Woesearchaeota archaeon]|nr:MAG: 30S ribosomal protein S13 [Candidatus Woesearchaeota archaeon]
MEKQENKDFRHLVRVVNTDLDGNKPIFHALQKIKGVSFMYANAVCTVAKIDKTAKTGNLSEQQVALLDTVLRNPLQYKIPLWMLNRRNDYETGETKHLLTGDLDFTKSNDIKRMKKIKSYKGLRHQWGLPVRGQRTKSNFRRNKGKVTLGVQKKKTAPAAK